MAWVLRDDDVDLSRCNAEDEGRCGGEEAEEATSCCVVAGEDAVERRAVSVEAEDDEDCKRKKTWLEAF